MLPTIIKPKIIEFRRRFDPNLKTKKGRRNLIALILLILCCYTIFNSTVLIIAGFQSKPITYLEKISGVLSTCFSAIFMMLLITNLISSAHTLFLSKDLERIIASPINKLAFFLGKFLENLFMNSWIIALFALPASLAFAFINNFSTTQYLLVCFSLFLFLTIPTAIGISITIFVAYSISLKRYKELILTAGLLIITGIAWNIHILKVQINPFKNYKLPMLNLTNYTPEITQFFPPAWITDFIFGLTQNKLHLSSLNLICIFSALSILIAYLTISKCHKIAFNKSWSSARIVLVSKNSFINKITDLLNPATRALLKKEYKCFTRDITQTIQLVILMTIAGIYIYNFSFIETTPGIPKVAQEVWRTGILVLNVMLGGMILLAICNRFVFSTVSLEGRSIWIIQSSPLKLEDYLEIKFRIWWLVISLIALILFISGSLANASSFHIIGVNVFLAFVISYGLAGLAVGLGACFAKFDWQYTYQITASFGSMIFMLSGITLLIINLIPPSLLLGYQLMEFSGIKLSPGITEALALLAVIIATIVNYCVARIALKIGVKQLEQKLLPTY